MQPKLVNKVSISFFAFGLIYFLLGIVLGVDVSKVARHVFILFSLDFEFLCCGALGFIPRYFYVVLILLILYLCYLSGYAKTQKSRTKANIFGVVSVFFWYLSGLFFFLISGLAH